MLVKPVILDLIVETAPLQTVVAALEIQVLLQIPMLMTGPVTHRTALLNMAEINVHAIFLLTFTLKSTCYLHVTVWLISFCSDKL